MTSPPVRSPRDRAPRGRAPFGWWPAAAVAAAILWATLTPARLTAEPDGYRFGWCLVCGQYGGNDVFDNILLFLPLGAALAWRGWTWPRCLAAGLALSFTIEMLQVAVVPGRFGTLSDLITNTAGATLGGALVIRWRAWLSPSRRAGRGWAAAWAATVLAIWTLTGLAFPLEVPSANLYGQWAPNRGVPFRGRVVAGDVEGLPLPRGRLTSAAGERYRSLAASGTVAMRASIVTGSEAGPGFAPIVRLVTPDEALLALGEVPGGFSFVPALRARDAGFRTFGVAARTGPIPPGEAAVVSGSVDRQGISVTMARASGTTSVRVPLTLGLGWALLSPRTVLLTPRLSLLSVAWLVLLLVPVGFYAGHAASFRRDAAGDRRSSSPAWLLLPPVIVLMGLGLLPRFLGCAPTMWFEWAAAGGGMTIGLLASLVRQLVPIRALAWQSAQP
jgi:hypothetical protein